MYRLGVRLSVSLCENVTAATVFGVEFFRGIDQHKNLEPETLLGSYTLFFFVVVVVVVVAGMSFQRGTPTIKEKNLLLLSLRPNGFLLCPELWACDLNWSVWLEERERTHTKDTTSYIGVHLTSSTSSTGSRVGIYTQSHGLTLEEAFWHDAR